MTHDNRPLLALTCGDPAGIGPEIVAAALFDERVRKVARLVVLGPEPCRPSMVPRLTQYGRDVLHSISDHAWFATEAPPGWRMGEVQASCGAAALSALALGAELAADGVVDGLVTGPVSKEALHAAGEKVEGQTQLLGAWAGVTTEMLAVAGELRVLLLTRHRPLKDAVEAVTEDAVVTHLGVLDEGLRQLGFEAPRLALAGLNPHAGENGLLGQEEIEILQPAVARARAAGIDVQGPLSPDTVFLSAARGAFDVVLALYHDQAFIPVKLHAPDAGLTVLFGLPYLRVSPAHGTAFDIAGRGLAKPDNLIHALRCAAGWAGARGVAAGGEGIG